MNIIEYFESIIKNIIRKICGLFHIELGDDKLDAFLQFVRFGIVGVSNTVISYLIYVITLFIIRSITKSLGFDYLLAQISSFLLSVLWSFYWNNKYVFTLKEGQKRSLLPALVKTYIAYSFTGLFLNSLLLYLWIEVAGISDYIAPIFNLLISVPINFVINKYWSFRIDKKSD